MTLSTPTGSTPARTASASALADRFLLDLRHTVRALARAPIFTTAAILSLALGIGANTAIFTIVHTVMLKALPVEAPQQLVQLTVGSARSASVPSPAGS